MARKLTQERVDRANRLRALLGEGQPDSFNDSYPQWWVLVDSWPVMVMGNWPAASDDAKGKKEHR